MENQVGLHINNNANDFTVMFCVHSYSIKCIHYSYRIHLSKIFFLQSLTENYIRISCLKEIVRCAKFDRMKEFVLDHILKVQTF